MTPGPQPHVVVAGSVSIDENRVGRLRFHKLGGVPVYAGLTYVREGLPTTLVANAAASDVGMMGALAHAGLRMRWGASGRTTRFVNHSAGDRRQQQVPAVARPIDFSDWADVAAAAAWVHLGPLHPDDLGADVYAGLEQARIPVVLDLQGLVRGIRRGRVVPSASPLLSPALRSAAIVKSSEREQQVATDAFSAPIEVLMERFDVSEWVSTCGARGGCIRVRGRSAVFYPAHPVETIDPTGAGDVFLAAYTSARLGRKAPVDAAADHAAAVAARQVSGRHIPFPLLQIPAREA